MYWEIRFKTMNNCMYICTLAVTFIYVNGNIGYRQTEFTLGIEGCAPFAKIIRISQQTSSMLCCRECVETALCVSVSHNNLSNDCIILEDCPTSCNQTYINSGWTTFCIL